MHEPDSLNAILLIPKPRLRSKFTERLQKNGHTYGIFVFVEKNACFLEKKNGGEMRPYFEMWFQCLMLPLSLHEA